MGKSGNAGCVFSCRRWLFRRITPGNAVYFLFVGCLFVVAARWEPWALRYEFQDSFLPSTVSCVTPFSPDGSFILTSSLDRTVHVRDVRTGETTAILKGHVSTGLRCASFSADGSRIVTTCGDGARVWDARTGEIVSMLKGSVWHAAFSPNGRLIACGVCDARQEPYVFEGYVWKVEGGEVLHVLKGHVGDIKHPSFSPDGSRLLTASSEGTACLWDVQTGRLLWLFERGGHEPAISPDGSRALVVFHDGGHVLDLDTGREILSIAAPRDEIRLAAFSPDGGRIVTAGFEGGVHVWDTGTGGMLCALVGHTGEMNSARFSPDGARVATAGSDGTVRVWDAGTGRQLWLSAKHDGLSGAGVFFAPRGEHLVTESPVRIWRRRRPEWWWGHLYRVEVWAAIMLGLAWLWTVARWAWRRLSDARVRES